MSDETQVQIVDCKGTYEVIVPANSDCLVMSIIKDKRPEKPEVFEWIM